MRLDPEYQAYVAALAAAVDLPRVQAAELDGIERRSRDEIDALDRSRREIADRWVGMRDNSARLARRVDELGGRVGARPRWVQREISCHPLPCTVPSNPCAPTSTEPTSRGSGWSAIRSGWRRRRRRRRRLRPRRRTPRLWLRHRCLRLRSQTPRCSWPLAGP